MDVKDIVKDWLTKNGYDGLYNTWNECACLIENLEPAECMNSTCKPGYYHKCTKNDDAEPCQEGYDWYISEEK